MSKYGLTKAKDLLPLLKIYGPDYETNENLKVADLEQKLEEHGVPLGRVIKCDKTRDLDKIEFKGQTQIEIDYAPCDDLHFEKDIKWALLRYGIQFAAKDNRDKLLKLPDTKDNRDKLLKLLATNYVPLWRMKPNTEQHNLDDVENKGLEQITKDYPAHDAYNIEKDLKPALIRYGIPFYKSADTQDGEYFEGLLERHGVPIGRMKPNKEQPKLDAIEIKGLDQIQKDYPFYKEYDIKDFKAALKKHNISFDNYPNTYDYLLGLLEHNGVPIENLKEQQQDANSDDERMDTGSQHGSDTSQDDLDGTDSPDKSSKSGSSSDGDASSRSDTPAANSDGTQGISITSMSMLRMIQLPDVISHETEALRAKVPPSTGKLEDIELKMIFNSPLGKKYLPNIQRGSTKSEISEKIQKLVVWFVESVKTLKLDVSEALCYFDCYLGSNLVPTTVAYLLNTADARSKWPEATDKPEKDLRHFRDIWYGVMCTSPPDLVLDVFDPRDGKMKSATVIGKHMNLNQLGVVLPSLSAQSPEKTLSMWIKCNEGNAAKMLEEVKSRKLFMTSQTELPPGHQTPETFKLRDVFLRKFARKGDRVSYHCHVNREGAPTELYTRTLIGSEFTASLNRRLKDADQDVEF